MNFLVLRETDSKDCHAAAVLMVVRDEGGVVLLSKLYGKIRRFRADSGLGRLKEISKDYGVRLVVRENRPIQVRAALQYDVVENGGDWRVSW